MPPLKTCYILRMLSIGIVGLPNVGKSTLYRALTRVAVPIAPYVVTRGR